MSVKPLLFLGWMLAFPLVVAAQGNSPSAASNERLIWAGTPYAPIVILDGPLREQGYVDRIINEVFRPQLLHFRHELLHVSPMRLDRELTGADAAVCSPAFSRTPSRQTRYLFTAPIFKFQPVGVVMRRIDPLVPAAPAGERTPLSLKDLLEQDLRVGLVGYRAHGARVDELLATHAQRVQRFVLTSSNQSVLAMLARGHAVDLTLVYAFELSYFTRLHPEHGNKLVWWPIEELSEPQLSYIACSPNDAGRRAVAAIDALLARRGVREQIQALYEQWLDEASRRQLQQLRQRQGAQFWAE